MDITDKKNLYKIVCARDKRYDGRFYCGVHTTGIYCRPVCPARPKFENISFYRSSAEAEKAGFRACLRCRPDLAPNSVQWNGTAAVVGRALSMIARGEADEARFEQFADRLGVSDRHLRRLFEEHVGASPVEVAISKRLHLAKQLLTQTNLPVTEVAFASGYQSIRQFNQAFKEKLKTSPSAIRKSQTANPSSNFICIELPVIDPFDWPHIYGFLQNHGIYGVENFTNGKYQRSFLVGGKTGALEVEYDPKKSHLRVGISVADPAHLRTLIEGVRDLFDTRVNPHAHLNDLKATDPLAKCYRSQLGIRIPGAWDGFETAICIILGQLVSVAQAKAKIKKLVEQFGRPIARPIFENCTHLFPTPEVLAKASFINIGVTRVREQALKEISRQVAEGSLDLSPMSDIEKTKEQLLAIKGIGPWTVQMIAMRCLGDTNAFPASDLIIKRALDLHKVKKGDWSPWSAYVALALWKKYAGSPVASFQKSTKQIYETNIRNRYDFKSEN